MFIEKKLWTFICFAGEKEQRRTVFGKHINAMP